MFLKRSVRGQSNGGGVVEGVFVLSNSAFIAFNLVKGRRASCFSRLAQEFTVPLLKVYFESR
jgi:hypothetical protein